MEQIYTIPVNEAFEASAADKTCGCAFCALYEKLEEKELDLILLIDRGGIEMYTDNGKMYMSWLSKETLYDRNQPVLTLKASEEMSVEKIEVHELESVWKSDSM